MSERNQPSQEQEVSLAIEMGSGDDNFIIDDAAGGAGDGTHGGGGIRDDDSDVESAPSAVFRESSPSSSNDRLQRRSTFQSNSAHGLPAVVESRSFHTEDGDDRDGVEYDGRGGVVNGGGGGLRARTMSESSVSTVGVESAAPIPAASYHGRENCVKRQFSTLSSAGMSVVTTKYDLDGKGYLDDAERAMRAMDTENKGTLDMHKVYLIVKDMQEQQKAMSRQQKSFSNLKKVVITLAAFSMILALTNLGTAFAAATLAKDTTVDANGALTSKKGSGGMVSTLSAGSVVHVEGVGEAEGEEHARNLEVVLASSRRAAAAASEVDDEGRAATRRRATTGGGLGRTMPGLVATDATALVIDSMVGAVSQKELAALRTHVDELGNRYVAFEVKYGADPSSGRGGRKADVFFTVDRSVWDEGNERYELTGVHVFECEEDDRRCKDGAINASYRLAPFTYLFARIDEKTFGMYTTVKEEDSIEIGGGLGGGL